MEKLLILGSNIGSLEFVLEGKARGWYTIVAGYDDPKRAIAKQYADESWMISTADLDELEKKCREEKITGVICGISSFNIAATIELTKRLGLPCFWTEDSWSYSVNKRKFKDLCIRNHVPVAKDYYFGQNPSQEELENVDYPVVVKAIDGSGNAGMSYCYSPDDMRPAFELAHSKSKSETIVVERMLRGYEYTAWYALADGEASLISFGKMYHPTGHPGNCYSVTTTYTDQLDRYLEEIDPYIRQAFKEAGCNDGVIWIEMMRDSDGHFYVLEPGYRISGDMMARVQKEVSHFDSYSWLLDLAMGKKHAKEDLPDPMRKLPERFGCSYILWSSEGGVYSGIRGLEKLPKAYHLHVDQTLTPCPGVPIVKYQYLATFTFDTDTFEEMCAVIRKINDSVEVYNEKGNIAIYFTEFDKLKIDDLREKDET